MTDTDLNETTRLAGISLESKAAMLSGKNFWETEQLDEAGIASVVMADGPHGLRHQSGSHDHLAMYDSDPATCFPPGVAVGSSWDPTVASRLGTALGTEAAAKGVNLVLGPGINIKRSPLCGRNFEYYSEDPFLSGAIGVSFTRALQSQGPGVSVKHFAANNQETNRQTISSDVDERTLREIYLPAFERVVTEAEPATVMTSYNKINGTHTWQNPWLLSTLLRDEWGFDGVVLSDWNSVSDRVNALKAGLDLEMPGGTVGHDRDVVDAVKSGILDESTVDTSVLRLAALAARTSLAARPEVDFDSHHDLARDLAGECAVLLRNEHDVLPIPAGVHVAVIGAFAEEPRYQGGGSSHVNATRADKPLEEIRAVAESLDATVSFAPGFVANGPADAMLHEEAIALAARADIAVIFAGLPEQRESEGIDRDDLSLPAVQVELIRAVSTTAQRTVVVLANGGVVSLEGWHDDVDAILEGFLLGQGGGRAIADLLFGVVNPSGHLAETIPLRIEDHPSWLNFPGEQGHVAYGEGILVGYRYFATAQAPVRYPFGHGLSYTTFDTTALVLTPSGPDTFLAQVDVTNSGTRAGKHVVQVYVSSTAGAVRRPVRELRGFAKVSLEPGESTTVTIELPRRAFTYWDVTVGRWIVAPGDYVVSVCADANTVLAEQRLALEGDKVAIELTLDTPVGAWFEHPEVGPLVIPTLGLDQGPVTDEQLAMISSMTMSQFINISGLPVPAEALESLMAMSR